MPGSGGVLLVSHQILDPNPMRLLLLQLGEIASSSFVFYLLYGYSYIGYFVCDSASEFGAMGSTSFLGFSYPNLLLVFLNLLFLGICIIFFVASVGTFFVLFYFILHRYFSVPYFGLACDHGNSFLCLEE